MPDRRRAHGGIGVGPATRINLGGWTLNTPHTTTSDTATAPTRALAVLLALVAVVTAAAFSPSIAQAAPPTLTPGVTTTPPAAGATAARVVSVVMTAPQKARLRVFSPSMRKIISVDVLLPRDRSRPRPSLYLLDGIDAGVLTGYRQSGWTDQTDIVRFMADKSVNVVLPIGGTASYYTDWDRTDPVLGVNKWDTFLASELPPVIDRTFAGNGVNAIGGVSMGATGAMMLAVRHPGLYRGVAAFSGCLDLLDPNAAAATQGSILTRGGNPDNMWGPPGDAQWRAHDPASQVGVLKGTSLYLAVGNGLPDFSLGLAGLASPVGGVLESGALTCTRLFAGAARRAGVATTINYRSGLHSWGYWNQDLHRSWPTVARALGVPVGRR